MRERSCVSPRARLQPCTFVMRLDGRICNEMIRGGVCTECAGDSRVPSDSQPVLQPAGLKSKRFMKTMLQQMKKAGNIHTKPLGAGRRHKQFSYVLAERTSKKQAAAETADVQEL